MDYLVGLREVRERCLAQMHPASRQSITGLPEHPMVMRTALFTVEEYLVVQGRPVVETDVPVSMTIAVDVVLDDVPVRDEQPQSPEDFVHQYTPYGRWVVSLSSVQVIGGIVQTWYANKDSELRQPWNVVGQARMLPSRGVATPMFGYLGSRGWVDMDALELNKRAEIVLPFSPSAGKNIALMAVGQFDLSDDEHVLLDMRGIGGSKYSLLYDWDSKQLTISGVYEDQFYPIPNPMRAGRLTALILFGGDTGISGVVTSGSQINRASIGRFDTPINQLVDLVVSCGTNSASRLVEVCTWQGDELDPQLVINQAQTLLAYYERRNP